MLAGSEYTEGLSPLAQGTLVSARTRERLLRFIPAGAGNTALIPTSSTCAAVYPRWRREHGQLIASPDSVVGLSPLAQGTPFERRSGKYDRRFIPAGAGNTPGVTTFPLIPTVYPRWRREHRTNKRTTPRSFGLSPLAQGTLILLPHRKRGSRFIPAGAGNTGGSTTPDQR